MIHTQRGMTLISEMVSSVTTYWMKEGNEKVLVCASTRTESGVEREKAMTMEDRADKVARLLGFVPQSRGSMARSDGKGRVIVVGMAEIPWSKEVENALSSTGLVELK